MKKNPPAPPRGSGDDEAIKKLAHEIAAAVVTELHKPILVRLLKGDGKPVYMSPRLVSHLKSNGMLAQVFMVKGCRHTVLHLNKNMGECVKNFRRYNFRPIHKSTLINPEEVEEYDFGSNEVQMKTGDTLELSRSFKKRLKRYLDSVAHNG